MTVVCLLCKKTLSCQSSLNRHRIEVHGVDSFISDYPRELQNYKCLEIECDSSFKNSENLRNHLKIRHNIDIRRTELNFATFADFNAWLNHEENDQNVQYSKNTGIKTSRDGIIETSYLYCVRSGKQPVPSISRKRFPKRKISCKINNACTSQIIVNKNTSTGECRVIYYDQHYGHENELEHLRIPKPDKETIASKLILGIPPKRILDGIRSTIKGKVKRSDMITRKDIQNIKNAYHINIKDGCRQLNYSNENYQILHNAEVSKIEQPISTSTCEQKLADEICSRSIQLIASVKSGNYSEEELKLILSYIKTAENVTNTSPSDIEEASTNETPNRKIPKQKKKIKSHNKKTEEHQVIRESLTESIILSNDPKNDHSYYNTNS